MMKKQGVHLRYLKFRARQSGGDKTEKDDIGGGGGEKTAEKSRGFCRPTGSLTNSNKEKGPSERRKRIDE